MSKKSPCSLLRVIQFIANLGNSEALALALHLSDETSEQYYPKLVCSEIELGSNTFRFEIAQREDKSK
ncbi:hypothetical protein HDF10_001107 [Edaphobacter lichenicola]|uniref:Uncharacterized protein n=1 Tax=Tunturiibacter lichenicola TaxID=2051959 RepID=A0A7W8N291_9BACT|nr:hypothetical protein [Edaphobacter lichenicola]